MQLLFTDKNIRKIIIYQSTIKILKQQSPVYPYLKDTVIIPKRFPISVRGVLSLGNTDIGRRPY